MKDDRSRKRWFVMMLVCVLASSCAVSRRGGVTGYHHGEVRTGHGTFDVGSLPEPWTGPRRELNQLVYSNNALGATVVVDALCGRKFDDAPLRILARNLFTSLDDPQPGPSESFELQDREALQMDGQGSMDGVPIAMRVIVLKKDFCLYDFIYFATPQTFAAGLPDFMRYVDELRIPSDGS